MKTAFFYIDDVIWLFRDLTRQRPASMFDHFFMKALKQAHDLYGAKFQMNLFYRTDPRHKGVDFCLEEMTDRYKQEFESAGDWLRFGAHAWKEFPDYPLVEMSYDEAKAMIAAIRAQVVRFAGDNAFTKTMTAHWGAVSLEACHAVKDSGIRLLMAVRNTPDHYSYGINCHNRIPQDGDITRYTRQLYLDPLTGLYFKFFNGLGKPVNQMESLEDTDRFVGPMLGREHITLLTHEQYSYPEYSGYRANHLDNLLRACQLLHDAGYVFIHFDTLLED